MEEGSIKNSILGLEVVMPDGSMIEIGGKVVKNVSGYDLMRLFTGSWGTLGVPTKILFKLKPLPEKRETIVGGSSSLSHALKAAERVHSSSLFPSSILLVDPTLSQEEGLPSNYHLFISLEGFQEDISMRSREVMEALKEEGLSIEKGSNPYHLFKEERDCQAIFLPSHLPRVIEGLVPHLKDKGRFFSQLDVGSLNMWLDGEVEEGVREYLKRELKGKEGDLLCKETSLGLELSPVASHYINSLRAKLDPEGLFNPTLEMEGV